MRKHDKRTTGRIALFSLFITLASIAALAPGGEARKVQTIIVTEADNGRKLSLARRDVLVVSLRTTPGTGYGWTPQPVDRNVLRQMGSPEVVQDSNPMPGSPAAQVFRFAAAGTGSTTLTLDYARPWEKGVAPARTFSLKITVHL
jgi:inhibitor of cysteine peptidase